jgi:hypothetical protein
MALLTSPAPPDIQLARETSPSGQVPLLLHHYSGFIATTDLSAPVPRIDTIGLAGFPLVPFSYTSRRQVPAVQRESPDQAHATSMPGAAWTVSRHPPGLSRGNITSPVSTPSVYLSTLERWFTFVRLLDPHLMHSIAPFP